MSAFDRHVPGKSTLTSHVPAKAPPTVGKSTLTGSPTPKTARDLVVSVPTTNLRTGGPQGAILKAATTLSGAWNLSVDNFAFGVESLVRTIDHAQLRAADPGLIGQLWQQAKGLLEKGATFVSGTPFAATIGFGAIEKLLAYQEQLEAARMKADEQTFIAELHNQINNVRQAGTEDGSNLDIIGVVGDLEDQFQRLGKQHPEDAWKPGDQAVFGPQHEFLKDLENRATQYRAHVPSVKAFETVFLTQWVNANHTQRHRPTWRSPFAGSTFQDGYVGVKLVLDYSPRGYLFLQEPGPAQLHCPKADAVAESMCGAIRPFSVAKLDVAIHVDVVVTDAARAHLPTKESFGEIRLDANHVVSSSSTRGQWEWLMENVHTTTDDALGRVTSLVGAA